MKHLVTESAVYGVILVAGLVVIVANTAEASWDVLVKGTTDQWATCSVGV